MSALDKVRTIANGKTINMETYKKMSITEQVTAMGAVFRSMTAGERVKAAEEVLGDVGADRVAKDWAERHIWSDLSPLVDAAKGADAVVMDEVVELMDEANKPTEEDATYEASVWGWVRLDWSQAPGRAKRIPSEEIAWLRLGQDKALCATGVVLDALPGEIYGRDITTYEGLAAALGGAADGWGVDALLTAGWYRVDGSLDDAAVWIQVDDSSDFPSVDDWSDAADAVSLCVEQAIELYPGDEVEIISWLGISDQAYRHLVAIDADSMLPGAAVGEIAGVTVWARTCGGQAFWADGEIRAAALLSWTHTEAGLEAVLARLSDAR